jgi:hypothetical protein
LKLETIRKSFSRASQKKAARRSLPQAVILLLNVAGNQWQGNTLKSVVFEISSSGSVQPEQSAKNWPHSSIGLSELWAMCEKQRVEGKKNGI